MTQEVLFRSYVPSNEEYLAADLSFQIEYYKSVGDGATVAQLIAADVGDVGTVNGSSCLVMSSGWARRQF